MVKSTHNTNEKTNRLATTRTILRKQRNRRLNITIILTTLLHKDHVQATQTKFRGPLQSMHVHNDDDRMPFMGEVYRMNWSPTFLNTSTTSSTSSSLNEAHRYTNGLEGLEHEKMARHHRSIFLWTKCMQEKEQEQWLTMPDVWWCTVVWM